MTILPGHSPLLDRWNARRDEPGLLDVLRADPATRVLLVHEGRARVTGDELVLVGPEEVPADAGWALLGALSDETPVLLATVAEQSEDADWEGGQWAGVREAAASLDAESAELLTIGAALAAWIRDAPFCPRCGAATELCSAGWSRRCTGCGREHFPRTDPAVIVAISSRDGERLLLGANALWKGRMFSCFAGFVEAGESLEQTVHREIEEEAGVRLSAVRFFASQPWPYPRSLMIGFHATATDDDLARPDGEEIIEVRWFTRAEIASALTGDGPVGLPGPASIARRLIVDWLENRA